MSTTIQRFPLAQRGPDGLAVLGRTLHDLRGMRFVEGEGGNASADAEATSSDDAQDESTEQTSTDATDASTSTADAGEATSTTDGDGAQSFSPEYVAKLRRENAATRERSVKAVQEATDKAKKEAYEAFGKQLGLVPDDEPVTVETLSAGIADRDSTITDQGGTIKSLTVELALVRKADKLDADLEALLDSRAFTDKADALDPTADDFATQVEALVKATVDSNPTKFKRAQVAAGTGGVQHAGEGDSPTGSKSIEDRRKAVRERRSQ